VDSCLRPLAGSNDTKKQANYMIKYYKSTSQDMSREPEEHRNYIGHWFQHQPH
jgi:hypothetical protein